MNRNSKQAEKFFRYSRPTEGKLTLPKSVFIYMLGGALGTLWEIIFNLVKLHRYVECSGSVFSPFNPVYGSGALVIVFCLKKFRQPWQVFTFGAVAGGAVEYFLSYCEETILGTRSWNYTGWMMDINGRTTVPIMLVWGVLCMFVVFLLYRPLDKFFERLPQKTFRILGICFLVLLVADMTITSCALFRYVDRAKDVPPSNPFEVWLDTVFDDDFMGHRFPSMRIR